MRRAIAAMAVLPFWLLSAAAFAGSSNSLIDLTPDGKRLLVANPDNGTVTLVDTEARKSLREVKVGEKPEGVAWIGNGPLALVTVYRENRLVFLDTEQGRVIESLALPPEPYGVVVSKDGSRGWITQDYPGSVTEIDVVSRKVVREIKAGSFLRGIAVGPEESRLYVTEFYSGTLHAIDLSAGKVIDTWPGRSSDNLCRHVLIHPSRPKAYLSHLRSRTDVADGDGSIFPQLSVCDLVPPMEGAKRRTSVAMDSFNAPRIVCNPWEAALSPDGKRMYAIFAGSNDMNIANVIDDDYKEIQRVGSLIRLGQNPRAVRVSSDGKLVYIYNALDFAIAVHQASDMKRLASITVCAPPKSPEWVRGKVLFSTADPPLTSRRWIACSSCHPDGLADGRVWQNPEGLRKTPALFGLAHTHPLHWSADRDEVQDFEYTIRGRLMQGRGLLSGPLKPKELDDHLAGRSKDLDAMAVYTNSFDFLLSPHIPAPGKLSSAGERGRALFFNKEVGCATCHNGPYFTDSSLEKPFKLHDVGTGGDDPSEKMGPRYDTPTLLGVYRTAPYLHHGKAKTLLDVLTTCNKEDRHGKTSHLKKEELADLAEFLRSLPYEKPPDETPNTVKYRLSPNTK